MSREYSTAGKLKEWTSNEKKFTGIPMLVEKRWAQHSPQSTDFRLFIIYVLGVKFQIMLLLFAVIRLAVLDCCHIYDM